LTAHGLRSGEILILLEEKENYPVIPGPDLDPGMRQEGFLSLSIKSLLPSPSARRQFAASMMNQSAQKLQQIPVLLHYY